MAEDRLSEIKKRCEAATGGTWTADPPHEGCGEVWVRTDTPAPLNPDGEPWDEWADPGVICIGLDDRPADADFIAHARSDIPYLLERQGAAERALAEERAAMAPIIAWIKEHHIKGHDSDVVDIDHGPIVEWDYCDWCWDHGFQDDDDWPCKFIRAVEALEPLAPAAPPDAPPEASTEPCPIADLLGALPDLTGGLEATEYVRRVRRGLPLDDDAERGGRGDE